jgi:hypothetical protein
VTTLPTAIASVSDLVVLRRESTRTILAFVVVGLVGALAVLIAIWVLANDGDAQAVITGVFTPIIGIAGTVLGFYFGSKEE